MRRSASQPTTTGVEVETSSCRPEDIWSRYRAEGRYSRPFSDLPSPSSPLSDDQIRFVCISDTHSKMGSLLRSIPIGDVLIHAGDFTNKGHPDEIAKFNSELGELAHPVKIVIAGNHEMGFGPTSDVYRKNRGLENYKVKMPQEILTNCTYLEDSQTTVFGYKIYGTPWHPMPGWDFHLTRGRALLDKWNLIPDDTDVLVTHTPPLGHGDFANWSMYNGLLCGCADLLNTIELRVKPKYHVFGHIHNMHGAYTNGSTRFINASLLDHNYIGRFTPIVFDLPLANGYNARQLRDSRQKFASLQQKKR